MCEAFRLPAAIAGVSAALVLVGTALAPLSREASRAARPARVTTAAMPAGEGLMMASLGGLRTLTADAFWLRAYILWERQDRTGCATYARLACALSPETPYFREGFASWMAFEFPHWAIREAGGRERIDADTEAAIHRRDAASALVWLDAASAGAPAESRFPLLAGQICDIKLKDGARAGGYYRRAALTPEAPWYPAWLLAEKLALAGRAAEAAAFMRDYAARVPTNSGRHAEALAYLAWLERGRPGSPR